MSPAQGAPFPVPQWFFAVVSVDQGRFALVEDGDTAVLAETAPPSNGIVAAVDGGLVVFTHHVHGEIDVRIQVRGEPADDALLGIYDDVVEISYHARSGSADVVALGDAQPAARAVTFPGPGPVRARVQAVGRDGSQPEKYVIELWQAPEATELVLRDAAEVAAARAAGPEQVYSWIEQFVLEEAACLTFVPGATTEEVLAAFHADPDDAVAWADRFEAFPDLDPFVAVLTVPGGVVAVEDNRWSGSTPSVLRAASRPDRRAASAFWNVNGVGRLGFARAGTVLSSAEWGIEAVDPDLDPEVAAAMAGIDYGDVHALTAKDVLAATRFTDLTLTSEDLETLEASGRAYRVVPALPALHPVPRPVRGGETWHGERIIGGGLMLSDLAEKFSAYPTTTLTDLAHWAATEALEVVGLARDPVLAVALGRLADQPGAPLDDDAAQLVRRSVLHPDPAYTPQAWQNRRDALTALHQATNPDPLGAAAGAVGYARRAQPAGMPDILDRARWRAARLDVE